MKIKQRTNKVVSILKRAEQFEKYHVHEAYYLEPDNGETFCWKCVQKKMRRLLASKKLCEIWRADQSASHDSPSTCDLCQRWLHGWLTDWGAKDVLGYLEEDFNLRRGQDCRLWMLCENSFVGGSEDYQRLLKLVECKEVA